MELRTYLAILWRRKWVIAITVTVTATVVIVGTLMMTPTYVASTTLRLLTATGGSANWVEYDTKYTDRLINTYVQIATSGPVLAELAQRLGLNEPPQVEVQVLANTELMQITVEDVNPTLTARTANTLGEILIAQSRLDRSRVSRVITLSMVEPAAVPEAPSKPRKALNIALGFVVGLAGGVGLAFLFENLDDTIKTPDDVSRTIGLTTLGTIGRLAKGEEELVVVAQPLSSVAEAFRALCINTRFSSINGPLRTILVTSPGVAEGKSITVANLAVAMAQAGLKVVAVDADLRHPRLHQLFGLDLHEQVTGERLWWGLTGSLLEEQIDGRLHQVEGLRVLPSGELPPNTAELLGSQRMQKLLTELAQQADVVLIDSPPTLPVSDAMALAQAVDGVLLVLEAGHTRRQAARHAVDSLRQVGANLMGVVLNRVPTHKGRPYGYSYHETCGDGNGRRKHRQR